MAKITSLTPAEEQGIELEFAQEIHAGFPSPAADHAGERIDMIKALSRHPETTFYAMVSGESMVEAGMHDGDIVVIDKSLEPRNGNFIVAAVDGEFTIKEFQLRPGEEGAWLVPHNPNYQPIHVTADNNFSVWGVITHCIHQFT